MDVERAAKECNAILSLVRLPAGVVLPIEIEHQLVEMTAAARWFGGDFGNSPHGVLWVIARRRTGENSKQTRNRSDNGN